MPELLRERLTVEALAERLRPDVTPEMGFQSYELLEAEFTKRKADEAEFLADELRNPDLEYYLLDEAYLQEGIAKLEELLSDSRAIDDDDVAADAIYDTVGYRMAEMYWLLAVKQLNEMAHEPETEAFQTKAAYCQELGEQLYGKPDQELVANSYGEILAQAHAKRLHPSAQKLLDELEQGVMVTIGTESIEVPGIIDKASGRLPQNIQEDLGTLKEVLHEEFADVFELVDDYWDNVVLPRSKTDQSETGFSTHDMKALFKALHASRDPENSSRISIVLHPNSSQLSWDTSSMSIRIGQDRRQITEKSDMIAKMIHEYGVHAGRTVAGLKFKLPILGTGLYTEADEGERSDYLTFEEGFASLAEIAIDDSFEGWKPAHVSRYMALASAYDRLDYRQAFEQNWRARIVMSIKEGEAVSESMLKKEREQAELAVRRIYRSTPTALVNRPVLAFTKDSAYLEGKILGLTYLRHVGGDKPTIRRLFKTKADPTNHRQADLRDRYAA